MKRFLSWCFIVLLLFCSCRREDPAEVAAQVAKLYYDCLIEGRYDDFVAGMYQRDSIPESYRLQLVSNAKSFVVAQQQKSQGLKLAEIVNAVYDEETETANVFLNITFGDGNVEQVVVPMVRQDDVWYMR